METWSENGEDIDHVVLPPPILVQPKKTTANRNLIQKIEAIISSYELQEKYSIQLTATSLSIIEKLIKSKPEFFRIVESTLVRNINGSTLYANDVPYIISIIAQLYNLLTNMKLDNNQFNELPADTCGSLLKFIINVAVREKIVKIEDETESTLLILCCDNIIDACTRLLKLSLNAKKVESVKEVDKKVVEKASCCCW
jgi:hypothetical protein